MENANIVIGLVAALVIGAASTLSSPTIDQTEQIKVKYISIEPQIHEVIGTYYNAVPGQCDDSPLITADNSKINLKKLKKKQLRWVALSRDLLARWGGPYNYGDTIYVHHPNSEVRGEWYVHDTMNRRFRKRIDFLVSTGNRFPHYSPHILISKYKFYHERT